MPLAEPLPIPPLPGPPDLVWRVPGSKSITNRALALAALADGETRLEGVLASDDTRYMRQALQQLGIGVQELDPTTWLVHGGRQRLRASSEAIFVGNSGTTVRFLAALAALVDGPTTLVGDAAMAERPIAVLVEGLRQLGVRVDCPTGCPPLTVHGTGRLRGGRVAMRGDKSSQYFSALLMSAALADGTVRVSVEGTLVSRPYVDITRRMMADFGGQIEVSAEGFVVTPVASYGARAYAVEPDASSASYPFALAAASGGRVEIPGLGADALQGDYAFVNILAQAGAEVERKADATVVRGVSSLRGLDVDMHDISDTVMTLAAIAPLLDGPTRIRNVANIRIKETDRLAATVAELERLGQVVSSGEDWLRVEPRPLRPATVQTYKDHRMAMSFAVLGALRSGVSIQDPGCVAKTYPEFFRDLAQAYRATGAPAPW